MCDDTKTMSDADQRANRSLLSYIRGEVGVAYEAGHTAQGPVFYDKDQVVSVCSERIMDEIERQLTGPVAITVAQQTVYSEKIQAHAGSSAVSAVWNYIKSLSGGSK